MQKSKVRRAMPWFITAAVSLLAMVAAMAIPIAVILLRSDDLRTDLVPASSVCRLQHEWSAGPTIYAREGTPLSPRALRNLIHVTDEGGDSIPLDPYEAIQFSGRAGSFKSIARIDLSAIPPDTEVCIELGSDPSLQPGDIVVYPPFLGRMIALILGSVCINVLFLALLIGSLIRGFILLARPAT